MRGLLRNYRTLRAAGVGRIRAAHAAWRAKYGRVRVDEGDWPEPKNEQ